MTTVLSHDATMELEWYLGLYIDMDSKIEEDPDPTDEYGGYGAECDHELLGAGMVATNPENAGRRYITQAGADYLNAAIKIITPFDAPDTPTPPNAEMNDLMTLKKEYEADELLVCAAVVTFTSWAIFHGTAVDYIAALEADNARLTAQRDGLWSVASSAVSERQRQERLLYGQGRED